MRSNHRPGERMTTDQSPLPRRKGQAINLEIIDVDDLTVASVLLQDAVISGSDMEWHKERRRFVALANRFRWEAGDFGAEDIGEPERVRSLLVINSVTSIKFRGLDRPADGDILSVLSLSFESADPPGGNLMIELAGGATIRVEIECLDMLLKDVTRPYAAPSRTVPAHDVP